MVRPKRVALFALTGLGNSVLRSLRKGGYEVSLLSTRREQGPFPYYSETDLATEASELGIPVFYGLPPLGELDSSTLLLCATYHLKIPKQILDHVGLALNLHPSLLPLYRGASPFYWVIRNGEHETGLTLHEISEEVDCGEIYSQISMPVDAQETQGTLRKKTADMAGPFAIQALNDLFAGTTRPKPQDQSRATFFPRFDKSLHGISVDQTSEVRDRIRRAVTPFPGCESADG